MEGVNADYCRRIEAYLCQKNDGHLIRIAGPSFTRVCGWAAEGIPFAVVCRGIDRYFERYYSRGPRRRPVQIDFCENDILDVFDEWRRAVGLTAGGGHAEEGSPMPARQRVSLPAHLERVVIRLTTVRAGGRLAPRADAAVDGAIREVDAARAGATHLRGAGRDAVIARLRALEVGVLDALRDSIGSEQRQALERQAREELSPFKEGMVADAYERAVSVSATRLLRERFGLPVIAYDDGE